MNKFILMEFWKQFRTPEEKWQDFTHEAHVNGTCVDDCRWCKEEEEADHVES